MKLNKYDVKTGNFIKTLFEERHEKYVQPLHPMIFVEEITMNFYGDQSEMVTTIFTDIQQTVN